MKCILAFFSRATLLPEDKIRAVNVHLRHKLRTTPLKDHDVFALLLDLFAAALVGEAAGGGLWRLSLIGGTRLITFYRASLWPSPSASSSLFSQAAEQNHIHHGFIARETSLIRVSGALLHPVGHTCPSLSSHFEEVSVQI